MLERLKKVLSDAKLEYLKDVQIVAKLQSEQEQILRKIDENKDLSGKYRLMKEILNESSKEARKNGAQLLSDMTTEILQMGFGEDVSMKVLLDETKNPAVAEIEISSECFGDTIENDPEFDGGGLADTTALSLLEAFNYLQKENKAPLFFDEPIKYVSGGYSANVARALYEMSHSLGKQTIMITHDKHHIQMGDAGYLFELNDKRETIVTEKSKLLSQGQLSA